MNNQCRSCGAAVRWVKTVNDKTMPVDDETVEYGNVQLIDEVAHVLSGDLLQSARDMGIPLYVSHFATCPNAASHRR